MDDTRPTGSGRTTASRIATAGLLAGVLTAALLAFGRAPSDESAVEPGSAYLAAPTEPDVPAPLPSWDRFPSPEVVVTDAGPVTWVRLDEEETRLRHRSAWWDGHQWTVTDTDLLRRRGWTDAWTPVTDAPAHHTDAGGWDQGVASTDAILVYYWIDGGGLRLWGFDGQAWTEIDAPGPLAEPSTLRVESAVSSADALYVSVFGGPDPAVEGTVVRVDGSGAEVVPADDPGLRTASLPLHSRPPDRRLAGVVGPAGNADSLGRGLVGWELVEHDETGAVRRMPGPADSAVDSELWRVEVIELPGGWVWVEERGDTRSIWFDAGDGWVEILIPFTGGSGVWSWSGTGTEDHLVSDMGNRTVIADLGALTP